MHSIFNLHLSFNYANYLHELYLIYHKPQLKNDKSLFPYTPPQKKKSVKILRYGHIFHKTEK